MSFWKKVLKIGRRHSKKFEKHQSSHRHRAASTYEILIPRCPDLAELFDNKEKEA